MKINIENHKLFSSHLNRKIQQEDYRYTYLINVLNLIYNRVIDVDRNSHFLLENESWLLFIEVNKKSDLNKSIDSIGKHLFIYGNKMNDELVNQFLDIIDLKKYSDFEIMGDYDLVYDLLGKNNIRNYVVIKDRIFYKTKRVDAIENGSKISIAKNRNINELIILFGEYYKEEYNNKRNKKREELIGQVQYLISENKLFIYKENEVIKGFCSIQNSDIGIVFVDLRYRRYGIAKKLVNYCTSKLLLENNMAYLMTDKNNEASNRMSVSIGYEAYYKHTNIKL